MNKYQIVPLLLFLVTPFFVAAESTTTPAVATTTSETVTEEPWYKLERITGNIDVGDFVVGPGRTEVSLKPGETVVREVSITNRISEARKFKLQIEDISGTADGSAAMQVIEGERGPYSIRDYISFPENEFTLNLGERARIPVTITVPGDAEPGGFYGSVLVSTVRLGSDGESVAPRNPIIARVGSHFFLTVEGEQNVGGKTFDITTLPSQWWYESGPITFGVAYENTGSIHVNPYGELSIKNFFGEEVGYVEMDPWFVLPQSIRTREIVWNREFLFGRYTAVATVNRGYDDILDEVQVTFWVLPWKLLALLFGGVFVIIFTLRLFFKTFEFKRKT